jgi:hypothetical protein
MQTICTPNSQHMQTIFTPNAHHMQTICTPNSYHMHTKCTPYANHMHTISMPNSHHMQTICTQNLFDININIILTHMPIASNVISFCKCSKSTLHTLSVVPCTLHTLPISSLTYLLAEVQQTSGSQSEPLKSHLNLGKIHLSLPVGSCNQTAPGTPEIWQHVILLQPLLTAICSDLHGQEFISSLNQDYGLLGCDVL